MLEQAGGLYGVIRWFKYLVGVFLVSCICEWNLLIRYDEYYFILLVFRPLKINTTKLT